MTNTPYLSVMLDPDDPGEPAEHGELLNRAQDDNFADAMLRSPEWKKRAVTIPQAIAAGLQINETYKKIGRRDGARGLPRRPPQGDDALAYFLGYREGEMYGDAP